MFQSKPKTVDAAASEPLLGQAHDTVPEDDSVFHLTGSDDDLHSPPATGHSVRFDDNVNIIGPSLRSTVSSREAGVYVLDSQRTGNRITSTFSEYELDSDEFDEMEEISVVSPRGRIDHTMPLLVGLMQSSIVNRESSIPLRGQNGEEILNIDLENLIAKRTSGGGMMDSVANMANSILGAGQSFPTFSAVMIISYRYHR